MDDLFHNTLKRFANRLQKLQEQFISFDVILLHELDFGKEIPRFPVLDNFPGDTFVSVEGCRSDVLNLATAQSVTSCEEKLMRIDPLPARAHNLLFVNGTQYQNRKSETLRHYQELKRVMSELGVLLSNNIRRLRNELGIWQDWQEIDPILSRYEGLWIDFVFEVALKRLPNRPFKIKKEVYWHDVCYEFEHFDYLVGDSGVPLIPKPIPAWFAMINDLVSASQYSLEFWLDYELGRERVSQQKVLKNLRNCMQKLQENLTSDNLVDFRLVKQMQNEIAYYAAVGFPEVSQHHAPLAVVDREGVDHRIVEIECCNKPGSILSRIVKMHLFKRLSNVSSIELFVCGSEWELIQTNTNAAAIISDCVRSWLALIPETGSPRITSTSEISNENAVEACLNQINPNGREAMVLVAMLEKGLNGPANRKNQQEKISHALGPNAAGNDNRRVFAKLKNLKVVEIGNNRRGFYLTEFGILVARKLEAP